MTTITEKATNVLNVIADGCNTRAAVAEALMTSVNTINGSLTALKRHGLIKVDDAGNIELLPASKQFITITPAKAAASTEHVGREGSKMTAARQLYEQLVGQGKTRKDVIQSFQTEVGLTRAGAATYYQTIRHEHGTNTKGH